MILTRLAEAVRKGTGNEVPFCRDPSERYKTELPPERSEVKVERQEGDRTKTGVRKTR